MKNLFLVALIFIAICTTNAQPTITSFSPISGPVGTVVDIVGTNFDTVVANNIVYFGATRAVINTANSVNLNVTVPFGAKYQFITVTNLSSNLTAYSLKPFVATFPCGGGITSGSFASTVNFTTALGPTFIASGDLDLDGKADVVAVNQEANSISVLRNTSTIGTVSFAPKIDYATLSDPIAMSIGDLDGDGKLDLVVANITSNKISVYLNTCSLGAISFAPKVDFISGSQPIWVSIGDLNEDGKPEIVVTDQGPNTVSVYENTCTLGVISFAPAVPFLIGVGYTPHGNAVGDLDGDGKPDIAVANNNVGFTSVLRNTSSGGIISFAPKIDFPNSTSGYCLAIGDLDGDGKAELASANSSINTISVLRNLSSPGTLSFGTNVSFVTSDFAYDVAIDDLDGDAKPELVASTAIYFRVSVLRNTCSVGTISFAPKVDFITASGPRSVAIGDLDNDGKPDMATANYGAMFGTTVSTLRHLPCVSTEVQEKIEVASSILIYPNPFSSSTIISFSEEVKIGTIKIMDVCGREINRANFSGKEFLLKRDGLNAGVYFIQFVEENRVIVTKRIIID